MKVDNQGNLFLAMGTNDGHGGMGVITPEGKQLGRVTYDNKFFANLVIGGDGYVYMTSADAITRVPVNTKPITSTTTTTTTANR